MQKEIDKLILENFVHLFGTATLMLFGEPKNN